MEKGDGRISAFILESSNHLNFVSQIKCPILSFHGDMDTVVHVEDTPNLDAICRRFDVDHQHIIYPGVNHSYNWQGDKHDMKAHRDSWDKTLKFLNKI
jgi:dienelactone hydrolase